ncbi:hypothetical protein ThidrDRAFT_3689 [Thiorhodococcus drewsii AZ1]|uniref:Sulfotransferase family protein n=1 Tax=Thiorhodococcus drewsii AZ1 TaxID=765913 RepID=G2E5X6_9GAMM|nr:hypothetical protein [Thiorhodococcus drewsii]EGV28539.1 hypothetical protein ThidrDRAFT_3689 [Thiorhodococcus drewsii AZ1]
MRYCFHHIPKTAGSAVRNELLRQHFTLIDDYRTDIPQLKKGRDSLGFGPLRDLRALSQKEILCGHWEGLLLGDERYTIQNRYPGLFNRQDFFVFTYLREPLELSFSMYFFGIRRKKGGGFNDLKKLKQSVLKNKNYISMMLNIRKISDIQTVLDRYAFIGLSERYSESAVRLGSFLECKFLIKENFTNKSERHKENVMELLNDKEFLQCHRDDNLDYDIYLEAVKRFDSCSQASV